MLKKRLSLLAMIGSLTFILYSCDTTSYRHEVGVVYPQSAVGYIYADQEADSISFYTFDTYKYYPWASNPDNFISVNTSLASTKIDNNYLVANYFTLPVYFKPNTTDTVRLGYVLVDSKSEMDDWNATAYGTYCQVNWHYFSKPAPNYTYNENQSLVVSAAHVLSDSAYQVTDTLCFYTYDKWTLQSEMPELIVPEVISGDKGVNTVPCTVAQNLTQDTLRTSLILKTANGAKTIINFVQAPKLKKAEE